MTEEIFGEIKNPTAFAEGPKGFFDFLSTIFKLAGSIAGVIFIVKIILAGYAYLSANGDEKKMAQAWAMIWQSIIGLVIVASAFIIAGVIGNLTGTDPTNPTIYGPGQ
jgi:type IV secretory pathway VirB2 component (pilin)